MTTEQDERSAPHDDEPLDVEMSGDHGKPEGVAIVLEKAGQLMREMPDGTRYDFRLEIEEVEQ